jgi:predicted component of type VI protein secretion system
MTLSLVTISHPTDHYKEVPFLNAPGPFKKLAIETWRANSIRSQGFDVEVHEEPYDPVAARNAAAADLASRLSAAPVNVPSAPAVQTAPAAPEPAPTPAVAPPAPAAPAPAPEPGPADAPPAEGAGGAELGEGGEDEPAAMTAEELAALRARVEDLKSVVEATALAAEFGIEVPADKTKLKDIKAFIIGLIDGE